MISPPKVRTNCIYSILDSLEKVLSIIFMMLACIQLSYTVNTVGTIIANLTSGEEEMKGKIRIINKFMSHKNITFGLKYQ